MNWVSVDYLKSMKKVSVILGVSLAVQVGSSSFASAQQVDEKTRDMLIQKLTQVYLNLAPSDANRIAITQRLADLHAERARVDAMKELNQGCTTCTAGKADRQKALTYYTEIIPKLNEGSIGKVLAQVGHLYEMTGNEKEAIATYQRIVKDQKSPVAVAEANLSLGEVFFKRRDYAQARKHYEATLAIPEASGKGLAAYRSAWCEFNDGRLEPAIAGLTKILKTPELLSRSGQAGVVQVDKQFQEEVSRDLATFLARRQVTVKDAALVYELSPETAKLSNVTYLATELERLGQVSAATDLWRFAQEKESKPSARLEGHIRIAQLQMEQKQFAGAAKDFETALGLWATLGKCNEQNCAELKARLRKFVTDWNRVEAKAPTELLLNTYQSYLRIFPNEGDMNLWAAKVASDLKQYALSVELNQKSASIAKSEAVTKESSDKLEAALLASIEAAELSKDKKLLDVAYANYLDSSRDKKKALEVRYQKANIAYEAADYQAAATALREVALSKDPGPQTVKSQAAELSLDALVLLKDDARLEQWSAEYAKLFPSEAKDFQAVGRKAVLTQSAATAAAGTPAALQAAWAQLARFDLVTAEPSDKVAFYKNKLILAEKMGRYSDARDAVENLLRLPGLAKDDQEYALSRKAWLAELVLDFETALAATEKIVGPKEASGQKYLKLAMYAELASKDAKPFYAQFLKESKDADKNIAIISQLVREAKDPAKELEKNKATLMKKPEAYAALALEIFAKTGSSEFAKKVVASKEVAATAAGKVISRAVLLEDYSKLKAKIVAHQIDGSNQKKMATTLKARVAMIEETEKLATRAIESGDWTSQLVTLDLVAKQNDRFYQEVLSLPVPQGLSTEEEQEYLMLLSQQAAPHQLRAQDVTKKVGEFWANEAAVATAFEKSLDSESGALRTLVIKEVKAVLDAAPADKKAKMQSIADRPLVVGQALPTLVELERARQAVRENPMSREKISTLLGFEKKMNRPTMVAYLEGRLATLDAGTGQNTTGAATVSEPSTGGGK